MEAQLMQWLLSTAASLIASPPSPGKDWSQCDKCSYVQNG
jgi:hypothetical protein